MTIAEAKQKLVELAKTEVGYHEGANNYNKYAEDPRITELYGWNVQNQPWCCTFVNWLFLNAFGDIGAKMTYGGSAACSSQANLYRKKNAFYTARPEVGDQIFFYSGGGINHTGLVVEVNGSAIRTVEGNYSDKVSLNTYTIGNSAIAGYGRPDWALVNEAERPWAVVVNGQVVNSSEAVKDDQTEEEGKPAAAAESSGKESHDWMPPMLSKTNSYSRYCVAMQGLLIGHGFDCGKAGADGFFGKDTQAAVNKAKQYYSLKADGVCDTELWSALLKM
jgi:sulfur carrier protein ThiS